MLYNGIKNQQMRFSQRNGKRPVKSILQVESIDTDLKNRLWNIIRDDFLDRFDDAFVGNTTHKGAICRIIWKEFLKRPVDNIPKYEDGSLGTYYPYANGVIKSIKEWYEFKSIWYDIYDFLEFLIDIKEPCINPDVLQSIKIDFTKECNEALEQEFAGYRIINNQVIQITSEEEIQTLEEASSLTGKLNIVSIHLKTALALLGDRKKPDYRNSIKESISGVESITKIISNNPKDSLGSAIDEIKSRIKIDPSLEKGLKQIYGYTSNADGIRHALTDVTDCDFEDAKFMLVSCSAFINYLIAKSTKAGITFE